MDDSGHNLSICVKQICSIPILTWYSRDINLWEETAVSDKGEIHNRRSWSMTSHHIEQ
jgi:hypothetical protein